MRFTLLAACLAAFALTIQANTLYELSSSGGSYSLGSGSTHTQFTINPFDVTLTPDTMLTFTVGSATLPESEIDNPTLSGDISYSFGAMSLPSDLWTMADPWNAPMGELQWDVQNDEGGWGLSVQDYGPDQAVLCLRYLPVVGLEGDTVGLELTAEVVEGVPEMGTMWLVGAVLVVILAGCGIRWLKAHPDKSGWKAWRDTGDDAKGMG